MLYMLGGVMFDVAPTNLHQYTGETGGDYAPKDIVGAARPREFVGEADTTVTLAGRLFPHRLGGLGSVAQLQGMARAGEPQMLVRGDGSVMGWFVIEKFTDDHTYLSRFGVGQMIEFEIELVKTPERASAGSIISTLISLFA